MAKWVACQASFVGDILLLHDVHVRKLLEHSVDLDYV